jgi:hypothetical protein
VNETSGVYRSDVCVSRGPRQRDIRTRIAVRIARHRYEAVRSTSRQRSRWSSEINARDVRLRNRDVCVADFLADERADGNLTGLEEADFAVLSGPGGVEGRRVPIFGRVRQSVTVRILSYGLELNPAADGRSGL